jgi:hypothetical protein
MSESNSSSSGAGSSGTHYRKASSIYTALLGSVGKYAMPPFMWNSKWFVTEKIDGSQLWIRICLRDDGTYTFDLKSHGGNECFSGALNMTLEKLQNPPNGKPYSYQGANLTEILPSVIESFVQLMKDQKLIQCHFYCEVTLPGKTPCQLPYPSSMKSRIWLFNQVYFEGDDPENQTKISICLTSESSALYQKYNIPTVPLLMSGDTFSLDDLVQILKWCDDNPGSEGVMFYQPGQVGQLLKIKTHHADSQIKEKPENMTHMDSQAYDLYIRSLDNSEIIMAKRNRLQKNHQKTQNGALSNDQINEEIAKEFTHDSHQDFLQKYQSAKLDQKHQCIKHSYWYAHVCNSLVETHDIAKVKKSESNILKLMARYLNERGNS